MPNRYVRESAIESERVNQLSWQGEVFFRRLINRVDDFGRLGANPQLLRASLFPLQIDKVSVADVTRLIQECQRIGLLATYTGADGKSYLVMDKWEQGRAKASKHPSPPPEVIGHMKTHVRTCLQTRTDAPDSDSDSDSDPDSDPDPDTCAPPPAIAWDSAGGWSGISEQDRIDWRTAYPACDIDRQLAVSHQWLLANPLKAKKKQWRRFITGWLGRAQERGGDVASNRPAKPDHRAEKAAREYAQPPEPIPFI